MLGVTVIKELITVFVEFNALNALKVPLPEPSIPVAVLLLDQVYVVFVTPNELVKGIMLLLLPTHIA